MNGFEYRLSAKLKDHTCAGTCLLCLAYKEIRELKQELLIKKQRIRFLEKANESWASKFEKLAGKKNA